MPRRNTPVDEVQIRPLLEQVLHRTLLIFQSLHQLLSGEPQYVAKRTKQFMKLTWSRGTVDHRRVLMEIKTYRRMSTGDS